jgi:hypothetical protein
MYFETKTFNPAKTNGIGSVGLIQFTTTPNHKKINGKTFSFPISGFKFRSADGLVHEYYKLSLARCQPFLDVYLKRFPSALNKR